MLHAGRSRNDQVATTLLLYCADRAQKAKALSLRIASHLLARAQKHHDEEAILDAFTHWQPAQPILLAFWLAAAAEPFVRDARRFERARADALESCPLGSGAVAGSTLPLDRSAACAQLGFTAPSRNAMDAIGNRDAALDTAHACVRALINASRVCEELIMWCTPQFAFARLDDGASTGSSLMPQKRNPDPLELVRAYAAEAAGRFAGALASVKGLALSYHRDLQITKAGVIGVVESALPALDAFCSVLSHVQFNTHAMLAMCGEEYTVGTDVADRLIKSGTSARAAHTQVGEQILAYENECVPLSWPSPRDSVEAKVTSGSTHPDEVAKALEQLQAAIQAFDT
jgi:argininosuccinate lyase